MKTEFITIVPRINARKAVLSIKSEKLMSIFCLIIVLSNVSFLLQYDLEIIPRLSDYVKRLTMSKYANYHSYGIRTFEFLNSHFRVY